MSSMRTVIVDNEHSRFWIGQRNWAIGVLAAPSTIYLNGRCSHDAALEILEQSESELIDDYGVQVVPS